MEVSALPLTAKQYNQTDSIGDARRRQNARGRVVELPGLVPCSNATFE
jgi:hypothetical protein